jgi:hypothetical protein
MHYLVGDSRHSKERIEDCERALAVNKQARAAATQNRDDQRAKWQWAVALHQNCREFLNSRGIDPDSTKFQLLGNTEKRKSYPLIESSGVRPISYQRI